MKNYNSLEYHDHDNPRYPYQESKKWILMALSYKSPQTTRELCNSTGIPISSLRRLLNTLHNTKVIESTYEWENNQAIKKWYEIKNISGEK